MNYLRLLAVGVDGVVVLIDELADGDELKPARFQLGEYLWKRLGGVFKVVVEQQDRPRFRLVENAVLYFLRGGFFPVDAVGCGQGWKGAVITDLLSRKTEDISALGRVKYAVTVPR